MSDFDTRFSSKKQEWTTPDSIFNPLNNEFQFEIDLAADEYNSKCSKFFTEQDDALNKTWNGIGWLNPPYGSTKSKLQDWIKKAHHETKKNGCTVVMLVPSRTNTKWWHEYVMKAAELRFICGRPRFGDADHGLPQPLAIVVFKKHEGTTVFGSFGLKPDV